MGDLPSHFTFTFLGKTVSFTSLPPPLQFHSFRNNLYTILEVTPNPMDFLGIFENAEDFEQAVNCFKGLENNTGHTVSLQLRIIQEQYVLSASVNSNNIIFRETMDRVFRISFQN